MSNVSRIVVLTKMGDKQMQLTGDTRGDKSLTDFRKGVTFSFGEARFVLVYKMQQGGKEQLANEPAYLRTICAAPLIL